MKNKIILRILSLSIVVAGLLNGAFAQVMQNNGKPKVEFIANNCENNKNIMDLIAQQTDKDKTMIIISHLSDVVCAVRQAESGKARATIQAVLESHSVTSGRADSPRNCRTNRIKSKHRP
jgi:phage-related protein